MHFGTIDFILPTIVLGLIIAFLLFLLFRVMAERRRLYLTYKDVIDLDVEIAKRNGVVAKIEADIEDSQKEYDQKTQTLRSDYEGKRTIYEKLLHEITVLEEGLDYISFGLYKPHYNFDTSEKYKEALDSVVEREKAMIREKTAITCTTEWTVSGSRREGQRMTNQNMKLMMRAFNGECDAAVLKVGQRSENGGAHHEGVRGDKYLGKLQQDRHLAQVLRSQA